MEWPQAVQTAWERLEAAGYEAFAVGGCVRDSLLGLTPHDWDITTAARPEQVQACFAGFPVYLTGLKHGTVTVNVNGTMLEITTYRSEGSYSDHRRPDTVTFVADINEDLRRRDFTVNAMAWNPRRGLRDPFGGAADLKAGVLRCVGDPAERFTEDALRVYRALRFASVYGFAIEPNTGAALLATAPLTRAVAVERLQGELEKLLCGKAVETVLTDYGAVLFPVLPELERLVGRDQHSPYHDRDMWQHTVAAVAGGRSDPTVRLALLLHDCAKPATFVLDENGIGQCIDHGAVGAELAAAILARLKYDRRTCERIPTVIRHHDAPIPPTDEAICHWLNRLGEEDFRLLLDVKEGDTAGHRQETVGWRWEALAAVRDKLDEVLSRGLCWRTADLAVNGRDVLQFGIPSGEAVGKILADLLEEVMCGRLPNERETLLAALRARRKNEQ